MTWYSEPKTITAYAGLLGSIAAIIVSIAALLKKPEENTAHDMYKTLVLAIERLSDESEQNRSDLVRLRKYVEVYNKSVADAIDKDTSIPLNSAVPPVIAPPSPVVEIIPPSKGGGVNISSSYPIDLYVPSTSDASINTDVTNPVASINSANVSVEINVVPPIKLDREWTSKE